MNTKFSAIKNEIINCKACELSKTRKNAIAGDGVLNAPFMLIGEAPGADEDEHGIPFIGRSGRLLMQMLKEIGISRENNLYITNTLKCRPPENRNPKSAETEACKHFLEDQIEAHNPQIIILVGNFACKYFLGKNAAISKIHGTLIEQKGRMLFPVYHPAAILRNVKLKPTAQEDFKKLEEYIKTKGLR